MSDFKDLSSDAIDASETMQLAGFNMEDLDDSMSFEKIKEVIGFFKGKPDKRFIITKIASKNPEDRINHLFNYVGLRKKLSDTENSLKQLKDELGLYEG